MRQTNLKTAGLFLSLLLGGWPSSVPAQEVKALAGTYCLSGVMEVGSCIRLLPDGQFRYFLAYGAYDENSEGTWKLERGEVVLDSAAYDRRPTFTFKRLQRGDTDGFSSGFARLEHDHQ